MNIDLELYRIFYIVAKNNHMTKASYELHISQPAISQSIKKLENQLEVPLFIRSNKGMELTKEGQMFYDYIRGALELINNAENEFTSYKKLEKGTIKIGISTSLTKIILMDTIKKYHQDYPNIEINITNDLTTNLINNLQKGKVDFVIYNEGDIKENNLSIKKIKEIKQGFIYNPNFFNDNINSFKELNNYPLILQKNESNSRKYLNKLMLDNKILLKPKTEVVSQDLILELTNAGLGVGFVIIDLAKRYFNNLQELNINKKIPPSNIYLATNKNTTLPFASKKFLEYLKNK